MVGALVAISAVTALAISMVPVPLLSGDAVLIAVVVTAFVLLLCLGLGTGVARHLSATALIYRMSLLIWWFVLICEVVFDHMGDTFHSYAGKFAPEVYGEGLVWALAFLVLLILSVRKPTYWRGLFARDYKWVMLLTALCLFSILYTPSKLYAAGWGFKLLLCVLLLRLCASLIRTPEDIVTFLKFSVWGFLVLSVGPVLIAFSDPATAFDGVGGRLNADPDALSGTAAYLLLLALVTNAVAKKKIYLFLALVGAAIMFLALGKAGLIAGIFGALVFLLLQKKVVRSLGLLLVVGVLGLVILSATPLAGYLHSYGGASTFTGRTVLWAAAVEGIRQKPILGHGYLASYFSWVGNQLDIGTQFNHLENSFMDVTYNNGLLGLGFVLMLHWTILRNIFSTIRTSNRHRSRYTKDGQATEIYVLSIGLFALYVTLFLASLVNSSIGGRAMSPYMLFLAVFMLAAEMPRLAARLTEDSGAAD
jgi:O-antigen ligase